jgi:aspartyl-tRNA(Asn)/glutamyl-tRNA(Gln) amidotransferase subunit B
MKQVTDTGAIEKAVDEIIAANPDKVEQAQAPSRRWLAGSLARS